MLVSCAFSLLSAGALSSLISSSTHSARARKFLLDAALPPVCVGVEPDNQALLPVQLLAGSRLQRVDLCYCSGLEAGRLWRLSCHCRGSERATDDDGHLHGDLWPRGCGICKLQSVLGATRLARILFSSPPLPIPGLNRVTEVS